LLLLEVIGSPSTQTAKGSTIGNPLNEINLSEPKKQDSANKKIVLNKV
jgi:hypothetical protein